MLSNLVTLFGAACPEGSFFGLPTWYHYLNVAGKMEMNGTTKRCEFSNSFTIPDLALVGMSLLDIALRLAGLIAVGFVIWGGLQYVTSQGEPENSKKARQTIINALVGMVIALAATGFVGFIGARIGQ